MSKSHDNAKKYEDAIQRAKNGDAAAELFLREFLKTTADTMPVSVLACVSEAHLHCRRDQIRQEVERN